MIRAPRQSGFTTVELLIAMVIGGLFLATVFQLFSVTVTDSREARNRTDASAAAYDIIRKYPSQSAGTCSPVGDTSATVPDYLNLPPGTTARVTLSCPYGTGVAPTRITVVVKYGNSDSQEVTYATYQAN